MHQASREELLRLLPSVELPEGAKQPLYEAGVMSALEDYEEEGVLTGYELDPNAFTVGTPGNTPASVAAITAVRKEMNDNKVPMAGRMAVLDTAADAKLLELDAFNSVGHTGETSAIINAQIGRKFGFDFYMDQNICKHENGDLSVTPTMKLSAIVSADSNVATFTDGSLTGKIKGTTDKFSRPSSHICTVLSSSTNPRRSTATPAVCLLDRHSASVQIRATSFYQRFPRKARSSRSRGIRALTS